MVRTKWFGQSAFALEDGESRVFIDPYRTGEAIPMRFDYEPIEAQSADVLLITHEHPDHNNVEAISGDPTLVRSQVGRFESPVGEIVAISGEHDPVAGTELGHNVIFSFEFGGLRVVHLGDLGQPELRPSQVEAIGDVDLLFIPVGGGITIESDRAIEIVKQLSPQLVIGMHYQTAAIDLPAGIESFAERFDDVLRVEETTIELPDKSGGDEATLIVFPEPTA
jgi:L-ascorbate metabolism protein UlaG (beta-lactamase superfamily)